MEYFGQGEIKRRIQPDGHIVEYHYDTEEQLIGVTNQRGEHYQLKRDALGRIVEEIDYWGQKRSYAYTKAGHLQQSIDPLGQIIHFKTDPLGRILEKSFPNKKTRNALGQIVDETLNVNLQRKFQYSPDRYLTSQQILGLAGPLF